MTFSPAGGSEDAAAKKGCVLYAAREDIPKQDGDFFIQDLIGGEDADDNSIGPANRYFKGRWSPPDKDSIFNYLDKEKKVAPEDLLDIVDLICLARKEIQNYREHPNRYSVKYFDAWKVELEESMKEYHEIMDDYLQSHEKRKVESELKYLAKWCKEKETVKAK